MTPLEKYVIRQLHNEVNTSRSIYNSFATETDIEEKERLRIKYDNSISNIDNAFNALYAQYQWQDRKLKDDLPF